MSINSICSSIRRASQTQRKDEAEVTNRRRDEVKRDECGVWDLMWGAGAMPDQAYRRLARNGCRAGNCQAIVLKLRPCYAISEDIHTMYSITLTRSAERGHDLDMSSAENVRHSLCDRNRSILLWTENVIRGHHLPTHSPTWDCCSVFSPGWKCPQLEKKRASIDPFRADGHLICPSSYGFCVASPLNPDTRLTGLTHSSSTMSIDNTPFSFT